MNEINENKLFINGNITFNALRVLHLNVFWKRNHRTNFKFVAAMLVHSCFSMKILFLK